MIKMKDYVPGINFFSPSPRAINNSLQKFFGENSFVMSSEEFFNFLSSVNPEDIIDIIEGAINDSYKIQLDKSNDKFGAELMIAVASYASDTSTIYLIGAYDDEKEFNEKWERISDYFWNCRNY